jgi:hypothetical protein
MPKTWAEVSGSDAYKALPPEQQESARTQYFNDVVAPKVPAADLSAARTQFMTDTSEPAGPTKPSASFPTRLAASVLRGGGPLATGAAIGGGLGAALGGVGAIPGAMAGAGAVGLTDLASSLWNALGQPHATGPTEAFGKGLTAIGVPEPKGGFERIVQSATEGAAGAVSGAGLAGQLAKTATKPVTKAVLKEVASRPGLAAASGASAGTTQQTAAELKAPALVQSLAGMAGGMIPLTPAAIASLPRAPSKLIAQEGVKAGYVFPPSAIAEKSPSMTSAALEGLAGHAKTDQLAAIKNAKVTNELGAKALGLPPNTVLSPQVFKDVREQASQAYKAVAQSVANIAPDEDFEAVKNSLPKALRDDIEQMSGKTTTARTPQGRKFTTGRQQGFSPDTGLNKVRDLRFDAKANLKNSEDPEKLRLGLAQWKAAEAIDDLIERNLAATRPDLVPAYKAARVQIAKSHNLEAATNVATGDVDPQVLGRLADQGHPLTGELDLIGRVANAFPKVMRDPAKIGGYKSLTVLDLATIMGGTGYALGQGNLAEMLLPAAFASRPVARSAILRPGYQNAMTGAGPTGGIPASVLLGPIAASSQTR